MTQRFGANPESSFNVEWGGHNGVDLISHDLKVVVPMGGLVTHVGPWEDRPARGLVVVIQHSPDLYSHYYHLAHCSVREGQMVGAGDILGHFGQTGLEVAVAAGIPGVGPHLHFGVWNVSQQRFLDPEDFLGRLI